MPLLPITPSIALNETSANVSNLQQALVALGYSISTDELARQAAGQTTLQAIRSFQSQSKITSSPTLLVDDVTAVLLNRTLNDKGLLATARTYTISGTVRNALGEPLGGKNVQAFDVDLRGARVYKTVQTLDEIKKNGGLQALGSAVSHADGTYTISFNDQQFNTAELGLADVIVYAFQDNKVTGRSPLSTDEDYQDGISLQDWDVIVAGTAERGVSEFTRLLAAVKQLLDISKMTITDLFGSNDQLAFLATETQQDADKVRLLVTAAQLARAYPNNPEAHQLLYGLGREKITLSFSAIALAAEDVLLTAWKQAIDDNIIDPFDDKILNAFLAVLHANAAGQTLEAPQTEDAKNLVLALKLTTSDVNIQTAFINASRSFTGSAEEFWDNYLPSLPQFSQQPQLIKSLQLTNQLVTLTGNNMPLVGVLQTDRKIQSPADLLSLTDDDWKAIIEKSGVPDGTPGDSNDEKLANYKMGMTAILDAAYPTQKIALMAGNSLLPVDDATREGLSGFFKAAGNFDISSSRIADFDQQLGAAGGNNKELLKQSLSRVQRLYSISPTADVLPRLMTAGFHSAVQIANIPQQAFVDMQSGTLGSKEIALAVHQRASFQTLRLEKVVASIHEWTYAVAPQAVKPGKTTQQAMDIVTKSIPNWTALFGSPDRCACDECSSVYGASAYMVDILQFLGSLGKNHDNKTPLDMLLQRRPDVAWLPLTCENTNTIIPYIDLVNEIMEYYVAHGSLDAQAAYDTGDSTADELRANPQNTLKEAYRKLKDAIYPFLLPYHQPLDVERIYYNQLRTTRAEVMTVLQKDQSAPVNRAIHAETLMLSQEEYTVWTAKDFSGADVPANTRDYYGKYTDDNDFLSKIYMIPEFLRSTGLNYTDVIDLLNTAFINPGQPVLDYIENLFLSSTLTAPDIYQKLKAIAGGADPAADADIMSALSPAGIAAADFSAWVTTNFPVFQNIITSYQSTSDCDLGTTQLRTLQSIYENQPLSGISITDVFPKIHRFIRAWNKLKWSMADLDAMIAALGEQQVTDTLIDKLAVISKINPLLNIPLSKLATAWGNIQTTGKNSLYKQLFLSRTIQQIDSAFQPDKWGVYLTDGTALIKDHLAAIQAAFRVSGEDLGLIFTDTALPPDTSALNLSNLSMLYRYIMLAKGLRLSITDLITLKTIFALNPFSTYDGVQKKFINIDTQATLDFITLVGYIQQSGFNVSALNYIIADIANPQQKLDMPDITVQNTMLTVRKGFLSIGNDHPDSDLQNNITADFLRAKMQLIYQPDVVNELISFLDGTVVFSTVTDKNVPVTIPAPQSAYVSYITGSGRLQCTGVLSDSDKTVLSTLAGATGPFQAAVQDLYQQPEQFIKDNFTSLFGAAINDALAQLLNHPAQVNPLDSQGRFNWFYTIFLPYLKNQLRKNVVVQTIATVTGMDEPTTQALVQSQLDALVQELAGSGLAAVYYKDETFTTAGLTRTDKQIDFSWGAGAPDASLPADHFSVRWEGYVNPPATGDYTLLVQTADVDDAFQLYVDDQLVLQKNSGDVLLSWEDVVTLNMSQAYKVRLEYVEQVNNAGVQLYWKTDTTPKTIIDTSSLYPASLFTDLRTALKKFLKASVFITGFKLTAPEVGYFILHNADFAAIDFGALTKDHWQRMFDYTSLRKAVPISSMTFVDLFALAARNNPAPALDDVITGIITVTGWNQTTMTWLIKNHFNFGVVDFKNEIALKTLWRANQLVQKTGMAADALSSWSTPETDFDKLYDQSQEIKKAVKAKYEDDEWLDVAKKLSDKLRQNQRDALVAYLLVQPELIQWGVTDSDALYEYFLIDVEMCSCMDTSRIVQATAAIQLFVTRCILNLESRPDGAGNETGVQPKQIDQSSAQRWEWMQYYRVWEANRKVFLYPENWLDPELRDDKSPFFKALESELLQNDITTDSVTTAFYNYLDKLNDVSHLDICGMYQENDENGNLTTLHVFGRTHRKPYLYYYRTCDKYWHWSAWDLVTVDVKGVDAAANTKPNGDIGSGVHLTPIVWKDQLYIFWPEWMLKHPDNGGDNNSSFKSAGEQPINGLKAEPYWEATLAWSVFKNGKWSPKSISKEFINPSSKVAFHDLTTYYAILPYEFEPDLKHYFLYPNIDGSDKLTLSLQMDRDLIHGRFTLNDIHNPIQVDYLPGYFNFGNDGNPVSKDSYTNFFMQLEHSDALKLKGNTYLQKAPDHRIIFSPQFTDFETTLNYPFFYIDGDRSYFVRSTPISYIIQVVKNPKAGKFTPIDISKYAEAQQYIPKGDPIEFGGIIEQAGNIAGAGQARVMSLNVDRSVNQSVKLSAKDKLQYSVISSAFAGNNLGAQWNWSLRYWDKGLTFYTNYHPYAREFTRAMNKTGVDGLMECDTSLPDDGGTLFENTYKPNHTNGFVQKPADLADFTYYKENVAFDEFALYGGYNWELFYHAPLYIATRLSRNGKYQDAMDWFHYIFDPTTNDVSPDPNFPESRYWKVLPFKTTTAQSLLDYFESLQPGQDDPHIDEWKDNPFKPFLVARDRPIAFMKNVVMKYIDNLIAWGDDLFMTDTRENINTATQLYIIAAHILGPKPQSVPSRGKIKAETYTSLKPKLDAFSNAMVDMENVFPYSSEISVSDNPFPGSMLGVGSTLYFCIPDNDNLLAYWDTVGDRLFKIRHCMNIEGVVRSLALFAPPIDPGMLIRATAAGLSIGSILADLNSPSPLYRFTSLMQKATEFCAEVKALGGVLLAAIEKKESEELQRIRAAHESSVLNRMTQVKQRTILEAKANKQNLEKTRDTLVRKVQYYLDYLGVTGFTIPAGPEALPGDIDQDYTLPDTLITDLPVAVDVSLSDSDTTGVKIIPKEKEQLDQAEQALSAQLDSIQSEILSGFFSLIPDFGGHGTPLGVGMAVTFGGKALSWMASSAAKQKGGEAATHSHGSTKASTMANFIRRDQEATHQANQALRELAQTDKQLLAADIRIQLAEKELASHQKQIDNAQEIEDYLQGQLQGHGKFTTEEMYQWMKEQLFAVYKQSYQMAFDMARRAEKAYQFELGNPNTNFIQYGYFDSSYQGLTSGEQLLFALKQLEKSYMEQNKREFELTKHISIAMTRPDLLLQLKQKGACEWSWPEELFDLDYPGHYFRRIKSVSLSIPCIAGPYTTVNATLRLLNNSIRINTNKGDNGYEHNSDSGVQTDDSRFVETKTPFVAIATSSAQNDSGMFELNFRDDRYLPFEGAGAIAKWRLELNGKYLQDDDSVIDISQFDFDSISDIIIHLRYTSREDAGQFRQDSLKHLQDYFANVVEAMQPPLMLLLNAKSDLSNEWYRFLHPVNAGDDQVFALDLGVNRFPFFVQNKSIKITSIELVAESTLANINNLQLVSPDPTTDAINLVSGGKYGALLHGSKDYTGSEKNPGAWVIKNPVANPRVTDDQVSNLAIIVHYEI